MTKLHDQPHKYYRVALGKDKDYIIYKCGFEGCTHYQPESIMINAAFSCYECETEAIVKDKSDLIRRLLCPKCREGGVAMKDVLDVIEKVASDDE